MRSNHLFAAIAVPALLLSFPLNKKTLPGNVATKKEIALSTPPLLPSEKETSLRFQTDYVTQYWDRIVISITAVCRSSGVFNTLFASFSKAGTTAGVGFEDGLIMRAITSYGAAGRQMIGEFLKTLIKQYTANGVFRDPVSGKILKTEADLVAQLVKKPDLWRNMRMGSASVTVVLVVAVAFIAGTAGYAVGTAYVKKQELEIKASEDAAFANALVLLAKGIKSGKLKLLPGVTQETAISKIRENLEIGRAPFINVFEVRPCPDIKGIWTCSLFVKEVKEVKGTSNIKEGSNRLATFTIDQEGCDATLHFNNNQISGEFLAGETIASQAGGKTIREEKDEVVFNKNPIGTLTGARLTIYGLGSGSLQGTVEIEIEQRTADGTVIISGGRLTKK